MSFAIRYFERVATSDSHIARLFLCPSMTNVRTKRVSYSVDMSAGFSTHFATD